MGCRMDIALQATELDRWLAEAAPKKLSKRSSIPKPTPRNAETPSSTHMSVESANSGVGAPISKVPSANRARPKSLPPRFSQATTCGPK